jgi:hypothetical protein
MREAYRSHPSSARVTNVWSYTSKPLRLYDVAYVFVR